MPGKKKTQDESIPLAKPTKKRKPLVAPPVPEAPTCELLTPNPAGEYDMPPLLPLSIEECGRVSNGLGYWPHSVL
jgi:hypothetical protein